jgi:hypothetical protein
MPKPTTDPREIVNLAPREFAGSAAPASGGPVRTYAPTSPTADAASVLSAHLLHGDGPTDATGNPAPLPVARPGVRARAQLRRALLSQGNGLLTRLQAAHQAGSLTPADLGMLQALLAWVSALAAEEDAARRQK